MAEKNWRFQVVFKKFTSNDVKDKVDNKYKIFDKWYDSKDIIFYGDIYSNQREEIKKRLGKDVDK